MIDAIQRAIFPELIRFQSRVAGRRALQLARTEMLYTRRTLVRMLVFASIGVAADQLVKWLLVPKHPGMIYLADAALLACVLIFSLLLRNEMRLVLRRYLRMDNVDICIQCGYDTAGLDEARCPECGKQF